MKKILGYGNDWSAVADGTIDFKVITYGPDCFDAALVRMGAPPSAGPV